MIYYFWLFSPPRFCQIHPYELTCSIPNLYRIVFESFKELCLAYQRGEWDAETFYDSSVGLLGDPG